MHRVVVNVSLLHSFETKHETIVSFVWSILKEGDEHLANRLHSSKEKFRPFVWAAQKAGQSLILTFSSINEDISKTFLNGAESIKKSGEVIMKEASIFKIESVYPVADIKYVGNSIQLVSLSPIMLAEDRPGKKKVYMIYENSPTIWIQKAEENLKNRVKTFLGIDVNVQIQIIEPLEHTFVVYNGGKIYTRHMKLKIVGDKEAIFMSLYGGMGRLTGSGFGMMTIV